MAGKRARIDRELYLLLLKAGLSQEDAHATLDAAMGDVQHENCAASEVGPTFTRKLAARIARLQLGDRAAEPELKAVADDWLNRILALEVAAVVEGIHNLNEIGEILKDIGALLVLTAKH